MKNFSLNIKKSGRKGNLLAALLMVTASLLYCSSAWAAPEFTEGDFYFDSDNVSNVRLHIGYTSSNAGITESLVIKEFNGWLKQCNTADQNICGQAKLAYNIKNTVNNTWVHANWIEIDKSTWNWNDWQSGCRYPDFNKKNMNTEVISSLSPSNYELQVQLKANGSNDCNTWIYCPGNSSNFVVSFTYPGFTQTAVSETSYSCAPNATESKTVSFTKHYGTALTTSNCVLSGTDAASFEVTAVSTTGVTIKFKPTTSGTKNATCTITDAHSKVCTVTLQGTATATGTAPEVLLAADAVVEDTQVTLTGYLRLTGCNDVTEFGFLYSKTKSDLEAATPTGTKLVATSPAAPIVSGSGAGTEFSGTGTFEGQTKYYYKTYAINTRGTSYSTEIGEFETSGCVKPKVSAISVPTTICSNVATFEATATCSLPSTYVWSATGVLSIVGEQTGATVNVTVSGAGTGSLTVTPTSTSDLCEGDAYTLSDITVVDATLDNPVISGDAEVCEGVASMQFTVTAAGATTYAWTVTGTGWSISSGADAATVTVVPGTTDGTVAVTVSNACQNKNTDKSITLNHVPAKPTFKTAPAAVCKGVKTTYELNDITGAEEVVWILPKGWEGSCGKDSKLVLKATAEDDALSGIIKAKGTNSCGSGAFSDDVTVTVGNPTIILSGEGPKAEHGEVTYPWEVVTITATGTDVELNWSVEYIEGGEVKLVTPENILTNPTNKTAKFKAGGPVSSDDYFRVKATGTASGCETTTPYKIYINNDADEHCD